MFTGSFEVAEKWLRKGGKIATVGGDVQYVKQGMQQGAQQLRELLEQL